MCDTILLGPRCCCWWCGAFVYHSSPAQPSPLSNATISPRLPLQPHVPTPSHQPPSTHPTCQPPGHSPALQPHVCHRLPTPALQPRLHRLPALQLTLSCQHPSTSPATAPSAAKAVAGRCRFPRAVGRVCLQTLSEDPSCLRRGHASTHVRFGSRDMPLTQRLAAASRYPVPSGFWPWRFRVTCPARFMEVMASTGDSLATRCFL